MSAACAHALPNCTIVQPNYESLPFDAACELRHVAHLQVVHRAVAVPAAKNEQVIANEVAGVPISMRVVHSCDCGRYPLQLVVRNVEEMKEAIEH